MTTSSSSSSALFEVEEKFSLNNRDISHLENRLRGLGFVETTRQQQSKEMTDYYYDTRSCDLVLQDCWLRYRSISGNSKGGQWQLKMGTKDHLSSSGTTTSTVYQEMEGPEAITTACSLAPSSSDSDSHSTTAPILFPQEYDSYVDSTPPPPDFPVPEICFVPFARIFTRRVTWHHQQQDSGKDGGAATSQQQLAVDLDTTDFGYAVGEVESVVEKEEDIPTARESIRQLIETLLLCDEDGDDDGKEDSSRPAVGKLEYFLERERPQIYSLLVERGLIRAVSNK